MSNAAERVEETYDLTNCDREPIHLLGGIQPIGFLIAASSDWIITRVSANIGDWCDTSPNELLGTSLRSLLSDEATHLIRNRLATIQGSGLSERLFRVPLPGGDKVFVENEDKTEKAELMVL